MEAILKLLNEDVETAYENAKPLFNDSRGLPTDYYDTFELAMDAVRDAMIAKLQKRLGEMSNSSGQKN